MEGIEGQESGHIPHDHILPICNGNIPCQGIEFIHKMNKIKKRFNATDDDVLTNAKKQL